MHNKTLFYITMIAMVTSLAGCSGGLSLFQPTATPTLPPPTETPIPPPTATPLPTSTPTATPIPPPQVISAGNIEQLGYARVFGIGALVKMKVSPDGNRLLLAYTTRLIMLQVSGLSPVWQIDPGFAIKDVTFTQDSSQVVGVSVGGAVKFWDASTGDLLVEPVAQRTGITHLALSPGGNWLGLTDYENITWVLFAGSGEVKSWNNGQAYPGGITDLLLSPEETTLAIAGFDSVPANQLSQWKLSDRQFKNGLVDVPEKMTNWKYSADGKHLYGITTRSLTAEPSTELIVWSAVTGKIEKRFPKNELIADYLPSPDGKSVLISSRDGILKLVDAKSGAFLGEYTRHETAINGMAFTPDSTAVISTSLDGKVSMWDTYSQKALQEMEGTPVTSFVAPAFASNADRAVVLSGPQVSGGFEYDHLGGRTKTRRRAVDLFGFGNIQFSHIHRGR
ncbi:MAG: WD40 repeat domain-containing protein [Anaerolineaceae bacterium]